MKNQVLSLIGLLLFATLAQAQDTTVVVAKNKYAGFDVGVGYMHSNLNSINNALAAYGYKPLLDNNFTLSISGSFSFNRFILRTEYTWQLPVAVQQENNVISTFGGRHLSAGIGYAVVLNSKYRIYPYVNLNSFTNVLSVREKSTASSMDELTNNQQKVFGLHFSNASLDFGLQFDKFIPLKNRKWDCPQNARFLTVGLRVGYMYGPGEVKGAFNNQRIEDAPSYAPNGPYVKLTIGFATKMRELRWK